MTKNQILEDINSLINTIEQVHPNPFYNSDESKIRKALSQVCKQVNDGMSALEVYKKLGPLVTGLNDGHTSVFPGKSYNDYIEAGKHFLPLELVMIKDELVINCVLSNESDLKKGDVILSINGIKSEDLVSVMMTYISSEDDILKHELIGLYFRAYLWMLFKMEKDFDITYKRKHEVYKTHLKGIDYNQLISGLDSLTTDKGQEIFDLKENHAVMTFDTFTDFENNEKLIDDYFDELIIKNIKHLIIDLRNNSGGDARYGDALLKRLCHKPFRQYSKIYIKISDQVKDYYKNNDFIRSYYKSYDETILNKVDQAQARTSICVAGKYIEPSTSRFLGQVYLLTSGKTYSSASSFVSAFHDYDLGEIIGESPAGYSNSYGDVYMFTLEHTGLEVGVSHKYHVRPNGDEKLNKIKPHLHMKGIRNKSIEDIVEELGDLR